MQGIYCLMTGGPGLTDEARSCLYAAACKLAKSGRSRTAVQSPHCDADVRAANRIAVFGAISGEQFVADVESELGRTHVEFVVHDADLEHRLDDGVWAPFSFVFLDLLDAITTSVN